jgi:diamine N-acetyltransferase
MSESDLTALRPVREKDLDLLLRWENDPEFMASADPHRAYSRALLERYIQYAADDLFAAGQFRYIIEENRSARAIGHIDLYDLNTDHLRAAVGILIAEKKDRRKGHARRALELIQQRAFEEHRLHQLYAFVSKSNRASMKLFEGAGFSASGELKQWVFSADGHQDVFVYQKFNSP